jgi:nucleoside-diphosphate-sugar epimerase
MKKFTLIGGNGFIGKSIQNIVTPRKLICFSHTQSCKEFYFDLNNRASWKNLISSAPKRVILLAWPGLDNYESPAHVTKNLPNSFSLVEELVNRGLKEIVVAGSCYEYGLQSGCLHPDTPTKPTSFYGIAKDALNMSLSLLCYRHSVRYCWTRIFFPFGEGQREASLVPALISAARAGQKTYKLGSKDLVRDFIHVQDVASRLVQLIQSNSSKGNFNCGSGQPVTLRTFVEMIIKQHDLAIEPLFDLIPLRPAEPFAYWADMENWSNVDSLAKSD